jgi:hypothetical protein
MSAGVFLHYLRANLFLCVALICAPSIIPAYAQPPPPGPAYHTTNALRIDAADAPIIDGNLSDPAWSRAIVIDDFYQRGPDVGEPGTERTELRIMYDENNFYVGVYNYHSTPNDIVLRAMARDGQLYTSDSVTVTLDPGATRRNGYSFQIAASGGRADALLQNNSSALNSWDTIWDGKAQVMADGWVAEFAIPFRSISYEPGETVWGFDLSRSIRAKSEWVNWSAYLPNTYRADVSMSGTLTGIENIRPVLGLDIQVYGTARYHHDWKGLNNNSISGTGGGNAYYKITPALTGTLTLNPDFSDSPLDDRQVNTTRFSLFQAETRDFFLQDAAAFEFGGRNFTNHNSDFSNTNNGRPFFSRNIGLVDQRPVSLIGGGKLSGEYAGFGVGAFSVLTSHTADAPRQILSVARVSRPILEESRIGLIVTNGDPTGETRNTVAGADFQYRNINFFPNKRLLADFYYQGSFSSKDGQDSSLGVGLQYPNEPWGWRFNAKQVGDEFTPALGFTNRTSIREYDGHIQRRWRLRDSALRQYTLVGDNILITGLDNNVESRISRFQAELETSRNDRAFLSVVDYYESVPEAFDLPDDVPVSAGAYAWTNIAGRFQTTPARSWQFRVEIECCRFYDGDGVDTLVNLNLRPSQYFELRMGYKSQFISLPTGSVDIHILSLNSVVNFTPDMQLALEAQFDNISQDFALSARYRWEYQPGNELFVAFGQTAQVLDSRFKAQTSLFSVRLGQTFRF